MLLLIGADPLRAYGALVEGAFGSSNALAETIVKATPLLLVALGIVIAFRGGMINIGGEGQYIIGALFSTFFVLQVPTGQRWLLSRWQLCLVLLVVRSGEELQVR